MQVFALIALVFVIVNGVQNPDPEVAFGYSDKFQTFEQCEAVRLNDAQHKAAIEKLRAGLAAANPGVDFTIETICDVEEPDEPAK
jgi:hypothetical protein